MCYVRAFLYETNQILTEQTNKKSKSIFLSFGCCRCSYDDGGSIMVVVSFKSD